MTLDFYVTTMEQVVNKLSEYVDYLYITKVTILRGELSIYVVVSYVETHIQS